MVKYESAEGDRKHIFFERYVLTVENMCFDSGSVDVNDVNAHNLRTDVFANKLGNKTMTGTNIQYAIIS